MKVSPLGLLAALCAAALPAWAQPGGADYGPRDAGRRVVRGNPVFVVELPENLTTGYRWILGEPDSGGVAVLGETTATTPHPPGMLGVGGSRRFTLRATSPAADVVLLRVRPGPGAVPVERFQLHVTLVRDRPGQAR